MPRKQPPKEYYTATQVKKILDISDGTLHDYVQKGMLRRIVPPGRKYGFYLRKEVDKMADDLKAFFAVAKAPSIFMKATRTDIPACATLSDTIFGETNIIPVEVRTSWFDKNPDIYYVLKNDDEIIGLASIVPLKPTAVERMLQTDGAAKTITADEVEQFTPGKPLNIYIMVVGVKPGLSKVDKRIYGTQLIKGLLDVFIELGHKGVRINTIVARSGMPDGIHTLRHMGFTETTQTTPSKRNFIIEVEQSGLPFIQQYKEALREAQNK